MFCPQCGKEYSQRVNFCCHCGTALSIPACNVNKKLMRSRADKKIAGVCAGFANYFELLEEPLTQAATSTAGSAIPQAAGNR